MFSVFVFFALLLAIGAMIIGMRTAVDGLSGMSNHPWVAMMVRYSNNPLHGLVIGVLVTVIMQSSSAVTMMAVGLVSSGIFPLRNAIPLVFGANVGTTLAVQLFAYSPGDAGWYAATAGCILWMLFPRFMSVGKVLTGFGLIFIGLGLVDELLPPLAAKPWFVAFLDMMSGEPVSSFLSGIVLTTLVMSSTVTIGLLQRLADQGLIALPDALPMLYGDNVGTTTDTLLASAGATTAGRQLAMVHVLFNVSGSMLFWFATPLFAKLLYALSSSPAQQLALAHLLFNLTNALLQLPLANYYIRLTGRLVGAVRGGYS